MDQTTLQLLTWFVAFWAAVLSFAAGQRRIRFGERFVAGLALGAVLAHLGWALLHLPVVRTQPAIFASPAIGYTILPLPLGLILAAPWRARRAERDAWLAAAFGALPLALAIARVGCMIAGCCHGTPTALAWGVTPGGVGAPEHPVAAYEIVGWLLLHMGVARVPAAWRAGLVLAGFGTLRLLLEPFRAAPPLGVPWLSPGVLAAAWLPAAVALSPFGARIARRWPALAGPGRPDRAGQYRSRADRGATPAGSGIRRLLRAGRS